MTGEDLVTAAIQENVPVQLSHLRTHPLIATRLRRGAVKLQGLVYSIATGDIWTYDDRQERFLSLLEAAPG